MRLGWNSPPITVSRGLMWRFIVRTNIDCCCIRPEGNNKKRMHLTHALEIGGAALLEHEGVFGQLAIRLADLNAAGHALGLQARGGIHRIAPDIVRESRVSDNAGRCLPAMDSDAHRKPLPGKRRL